jgi:hypothetical protein
MFEMKMYALLFFSAMLQVVAAEREMVGGINPLIGAVPHSESGRHWEMFDRRIGLFLHWGIYSVNGWHEQEEMRRKVNRGSMRSRQIDLLPKSLTLIRSFARLKSSERITLFSRRSIMMDFACGTRAQRRSM